MTPAPSAQLSRGLLINTLRKKLGDQRISREYEEVEEVKDMHNSAAQRLETVEGQEIYIAPSRVTYLRPSIWEGVRAWAKEMLTGENITEATFVTATFFLWGWLLFSLYQALENYLVF